MSVSKSGVSFISDRRKKRFGIFALVLILEGAFTFLLYLSLAGHIFSPDPSQAAAGVPKLISYQGRLTDTSGNPLGGAGTYYCFRYSIYDALTSGNKVWPSGTPTTATTTVRDGVFSDQVGRLDSLAGFDFFATSTLYLNVEANTATTTCSGAWESLSPRQQITASGFALTSEDVYGDALRTPTSTKVQVGTGLGIASGQTLLSLDVKNVADSLGAACTDNGSIWYNSINTRALICEAGIIQPISNSSTTITGVGTNATAPITAGNIVFSNSNGVSFGQNGSTITASVGAAGGGATYSSTVIGNERGWAQSSVSLGQNSIYFAPHILQNAISAIAVKIPVMVTNSSIGSSSGNVGYTAKFAIYTTNATNSTVLSLHYSTSWTMQVSNSSNASRAASFITGFNNSTSYNSVTSSSAGLSLSSLIHGPREIIMPISSLLTAGYYWFAMANSSSLIGGTSNNVLAMSYIIASSQTVAKFGNATSATSGLGIAKNIGLGTYSATSNGFPGGVSITQINKAATNPIYYIVNQTN